MNVPTEEVYELIVKNSFYEYVPVPTGGPRRNSCPDVLLRTCFSDSGHQEGATQPNKIPEIPMKSQRSDSCTPCQAQVITTLMLRNIPCKVNLQMMQVVLKRLGFEGSYDYLYFPARKNKSNLGFGFVNFKTEADAASFEAAFLGYMFPGIQSSKRCHANAAEVQGLEANLRLRASDGCVSSLWTSHV
eukprot:TRINITY_DN57315_c0_g1_i1.p1 TRINITY_DN57315_c0_g1~~TRINITY_DN57315_c0_g1_i1.p1  ORF type:complete len:188 (+),score=14.75 TRINITY_DN57315_c0_g1_i1:109-672(+)